MRANVHFGAFCVLRRNAHSCMVLPIPKPYGDDEMTRQNNGGPAFPLVIEEEGCITQYHHGMSLRDWLAGQAVAGLLAGQYRDTSRHNLAEVPAEACRIADAMLEMLDAGAAK